MLILLPPSETKRPGGAARPLDLSALSHAALAPQRASVIEALIALSHDPDEAARLLKMGRSQRGDIGHNAMVRSSPTRPAVDRYSGVLYDALDAGSLDPSARRWLGRSVAVQSALFGLIGALDAIPTYRLSAAVVLPGLPTPRRVWADVVAAAIAAASASFVLDLRSEAYAALGPIPPSVPSAYVRVVTAGPDGSARALNHYNKHFKGALVRHLAQTRPRIRSRGAFLRWADAAGIRTGVNAVGEVELYV